LAHIVYFALSPNRKLSLSLNPLFDFVFNFSHASLSGHLQAVLTNAQFSNFC